MDSCNINSPAIDESNQPKPAYNGQPVRIKLFWTQSVVSSGTSYYESFSTINAASETLRNHTLSLDQGSLNHHNFVLPVNTPVFLGGTNEMEWLMYLQHLVKNTATNSSYTPEENRLLVIFTHINSNQAGKTILKSEWLPFVLVDPTNDDMTLIHEMGHACRCAHAKGSIMEACSGYSGLKNFYNLQLNEIYKSYWCTGSRPQNWWNTFGSVYSPNRGPFMWEPFGVPS